MTRKFVVDSKAVCATCDTMKISRLAESWAKAHAKANPLHRVYFIKAWCYEAPLKVKLRSPTGKELRAGSTTKETE